MSKLSPAISALKAAHWQHCLAPHLLDGEVIVAFVSAHRLKPTVEGVAVTNARVLGFHTAAPSRRDVITMAVAADEIVDVELVSAHMIPTLTIRTADKAQCFGEFHREEMDFLTYFLDTLRHDGADEAVRPALDQWRSEARQSADTSSRRRERRRVPVYGEPMTSAQWAAIERSTGSDEYPWMILNCGRHGQLAAFTDRVVIRKAGRTTDLPVGEHLEVIPFADIVDVTYRCGALSGVLEVVTKECPATYAEGFWPSAVSDHTEALPNVLRVPKAYYQGAQDGIEKLRQHVRAGEGAGSRTASAR
ncbi:hypothetical protein ABLE94_22075 [Gordonia sp. VNK1]|uniref:hypothetical protein n=1 Tax=Gordonia oleivorans TaxID=3156618 RepID=UPI0032B3AC9C